METNLPNVTISATVGHNYLYIYGYGPAEANVTLMGRGVWDKTVSKKNGYFSFPKVYSLSNSYPELCLYGVDTNGRTTSPSCIAPSKEENFNLSKIGPILLSPTISLESGKAVLGDNVSAQGAYIPNRDIGINFSRKVNAYSIPTYKVKTDDKGEFEFSLPTQDNAKYKIFAYGKEDDNYSAKSNTLNFEVVSLGVSFWQNLLKKILYNKGVLVVILEILAIGILVRNILGLSTRAHNNHRLGN